MDIWQTINSYLYILLPLVLLIIGIIVATSIKDSQTDKEKGDKRLVAAIFILTAFIIFLTYKLYVSEKYSNFLLQRSMGKDTVEGFDRFLSSSKAKRSA